MPARRHTGRQRESWVDRQIREAAERGEFDALPGAGRPLADLDGRHDELWWIRRKLREERISSLPPTLQVRRELELAHERIDRADSADEVRRIVAAINERIRYVNRTAISGPPSTLMPLDEDATVQHWRQRAGRADHDD